MTEFQLGLLLIGVLAIVAVIVFNWVQERTATRRAERAFGSRHEDVLFADAQQRREPTLEAADRKASPEQGGSAQTLPNAALDYVIELTAARPLPAAAFLEYWTPLEHRFAKRVLVAAQDQAGAWKHIVQGDPAAYNAFQIALQLVTRAGVVSEGELIEFRSEVENLAATLRISAAAPEMKQAMDRARELDQFCADADIQIVLNLVPSDGSGFPDGKLQSAILAAGLERLMDGKYVLRDALGRVHYVLFTVLGDRAGEVAKLAFSLDVPRVPEVQKAYDSMARLARQFAASLGGSLIDDNGRPLDEQSLAAIGAELDVVRQSLDSRGLTPGGALALRLFS